MHRQRGDDRRRRQRASEGRRARDARFERAARSGARLVNFEAVLAGLPDAVIAVDTELRVVFWNSAAEMLAERSARRAEGRLLKEIFPGDASIVRRLAETLATGESRSEAEALIERADHREVPVSLVTAALFGKDGTVGGAVALLRDLSRIRQLEAEVH